MAAKRDESSHECMYIQIEQAERQVIPSIQLEQREIKMTYLPSEQSVPCIITTSDENNKDADRIVGEERPLGVESFATSSLGVQQQNGHHEEITKVSSSRVVEYQSTTEHLSTQTLQSTKTHQHDVSHANVLEYFEEQGKTFQEKSGSLPRLKAKKPRSASPSPIRQSSGLDHLDHLVKLMEQMSSLREENVKLKKKCDYLESTKTLLQVKTELNSELGVSGGYHTLPSKSKSKSKSKIERKPRPRLPSAEDIDLDDVESSPETGLKRRFSTGSVDVPSEHSNEEEIIEQKSEDKVTKLHNGSRFWKKFKLVISKRLPENRSRKDIGRSSSHHGHIRYGSVGTAQELTVPTTSGVLESRSVDSGVGSGLEADGQEVQRKSTSSGESPSAFSSQQGVPSGEQFKGDDDDSYGIWMGPPDWQEQHKEEMQIGNIIENKEVIYLKNYAKTESENHLQVPFPRRKSSPSLIDHDDRPMDLDGEEYSRLRRSSSYKGRSSHGEIFQEMPASPKSEKKLPLKTWKKVKSMVSTRKDSLKKKITKRTGHWKTDSGEELSEMDIDRYGYEMYEEHLEGPISRSTPKTSPMAIRQRREKSMSNSPPGVHLASMQVGALGGNLDMGGMSDPEFSKKLKEWEKLKNERLSEPIKDSSDEAVFSDSVGTTSPEFQKKTEDKDRSRSVKSTLSQDVTEERVVPDMSREGSPDGIATPPESMAQVAKLEELFNRKLTDSFSRKMEEWEKLKYRDRREGSPSLGRKDSATKSGIRKEERQKSRRSKEEKDKEKLEKLREREMQRVEKEQQKLEKERIRLEKERLKALEREAKIEKMKGRLSQPDMESKFKSPILSPLGEYKVTSDFARKLHEWELIKGTPGTVSTATYLEAQHRGLEHSFQSDYTSSLKKDSFGDESSVSVEEPRPLAKGQRPPPLTLQPCSDSPDEVSPGCRSSDASSIDGTEDDEDDHTSVTTEGLTDSNISSLEKANIKLLEELQKKELEYAALQEEVREINSKVEKIKEQHSKDMDRYKQEVTDGGQTTSNLPSPSTVTTLSDLQGKIMELKDFGENLAVSMETAAFCKIKSIEGEGSVNTRLMELLEQMRIMLLQASQTEEISKKSSALHSFEKLYGQAMQLQVQLNNLRLTQLERNKEIMTMKRQLLLQEANNLLLQADITRRETELHYYRQYARRNAAIKRWNTYGGMESRVVEGKEADHIPPYKRFTQGLKDPGRPPIACSDDILETTEPSTSEDTSKEEMSLKIDDSSGQPIDIHAHISSSALAAKLDSPQTHKRNALNISGESLIEIDHTEKYIKHKETEDSVLIKDDRHEGRKSIDGVEISLTITLPTASISLPRDISQQELAVPRSHRSKESSPPDKSDTAKEPKTDHSESEMPKAETKFPELLIPEWRKTPERTQLKRSGNVEELEPDSWVHSVVDSRTDSSIDSYRKSFTSECSQTESESQTMEDTDTASFEQEITFQKSPHLAEEQRLETRGSPKGDQLVKSKSKSKQFRKFEKVVVATKIETSASQQSPVYSKTMQMQVHWPQIKHVPIIHRIKPAEELLQESQRYRKGHSIFMTRILQKYAVGENTRKYYETQRSLDKENITEGYVQTMIKRLSRESTPDHGKQTSESSPKMVTALSLQRADSPRACSEFVQHIVRKLSTPSGPEQTRTVVAPLKDLTNGASGVKVRQLAEAFDSGGSRLSPERALSDSECQPVKSVISKKYHKPSESLNVSYDSSSQSTLTSQSLGTVDQVIDLHKPDSTISATAEFSSLPLISVKEEQDSYEGYRERAATTTTCDTNAEQGIKSETDKQEIHLTIMSVPPGGSSDPSAAQSSKHQEEERHISEKTIFPKKTELRYPQKLIHRRGGKIKMGTIGVLCQQTMLSFDLGMTLHAAEQEKSSEVILRRSGKGQERPLSAGSIEGSETPPTSADEKRKSRTKFFEASWFHKPKRFFKVSK